MSRGSCQNAAIGYSKHTVCAQSDTVRSQINPGVTVAEPRFAGIHFPGLYPLNNFNELVANKVTANYIDVTVGLSANYATIGKLNTVTAEVDILKADHVSINDLDVVKANFKNLNASYIKSGTLSAARIDVDNLFIGAHQITGTKRIKLFTDFKSDVICYLDGNTGEKKIKDVLTYVIGEKYATVLGVE